MTTTMAGSIQGYLAARRALVDAALERWLPAPPRCPQVLDEAIRYSLRAGGKRLRPLLTLAAAEAVAVAGGDAVADGNAGSGGDARSDEQAEATRVALPAACAIEMIHTYSLIHDDLPAMDNDSLRRGQPTSHVKFGEGQAILAGDGLLTEAFALLAREPAHSDIAVSVRKLRTIALVSTAAGVEGMVGGQAIDLHAARPLGAPPQSTATAFTPDALRDMHARKTGALIRAAALAGALMAGASPEAEAAIDTYGTNLGLAFQIVDDILDVEGTDQTLGKTAGKDAADGKPTYPALFGLDASKRLARDAVNTALAALDQAHVSGRLPEIAAWVVERTN
jgi:geranylgeranyl diphosphate synthase type II